MWSSYAQQVFLWASLMSLTIAQGRDDGTVTSLSSSSQTTEPSSTPRSATVTSSPRTETSTTSTNAIINNATPVSSSSSSSSISSSSLSFDISRASTLSESTYMAPSSTIPSSSIPVISSVAVVPASTTSTAAPSSSSQTLATSTRSTSSSTPTLIDVLVLTTYVADGSTTIPTVLSRTVVKIGTVTGSSIAEVTAALNAASQQNSGSGLSSDNKKIIIGVVAGVGGLVVLAALGTLLYRILGKRRSHAEYSEAKTGSPDTSYDSDLPDFNPGARPRPGEISQNF